ncbi:sensor histidine kinase [Micromonospora costi]|uniref:histidine kinase n=1 Tax=Micromonospora costi TaxID=1530042 RepID=A0A3A9ZRU2_9ACTN|nr:histidine kinase [Micromonospora costi]RKN50167.1 two-component sensor histidine kinase [Micromonospora costi]
MVVTRSVSRLFDDRYAWLRLTLLCLSGVGYLLLRPHPTDPYTPADWLFAAAALTLGPFGVRWPLVTALASALVFGLAGWFGQAEPVVPQVGATWAVVELTLRVPTRQVAVGAAALLAAYLADSHEALPAGLPTWLYGIAVTVGVPLLLGLNIRASRQLAGQAEQRVAVEARAARTSERAAIARELHDLVAHHVASMVLRVGVARHVLSDTDPRVREVFDDLHTSGSAALADLRRLVTVLRNPALVGDGSGYVPIEPGALPEALAEAVDRAVKTGLTVDATIDPEVATLDTVRGLAVLRLTQEGLANVARHAGPAARARVCVRMRDGAVHWEVSDDGGGGTVTDAAPGRGSDGGASRRISRRAETGSGHGLTGMRERVELLGGTLVAGPDGPGWRLRTVLPAGADR